VSEQSGDLTRAYAHRVGQRLRSIRRQKGLSLQEVESISDQEFKASVLGAYERGERVISVSRLQRLAGLYNVPVDQLLPPPGEAAAGTVTVGGAEVIPTEVRAHSSSTPAKVTFDLTRIDQVAEPELEMLNRYLKAIMVQRQDFNGRMLTIRNDDIQAVAGLFGVEPAELVARLDAHQLRVADRAVLAEA
jgi:transcriptional regulator with XRE-family HTH domain